MQGLSRRAGLAAAAVTALAVAAPAIAGQNQVDVEDDDFVPRNSTQILGSETLWSWQPGVKNPHNVRENSKLFYSGALTADPKTAYSTPIPSGTFHYYCEEHGTKNGGMDGTVKVQPEIGSADVDLFVVTWGDADAGPVQYDVQYKVGKGDWKNWVKNKTALSREFGDDNKPVDVKPGKTYRVRARTEKISNPDKRSGFSPATKHTVDPR